MYSGVQDQQRAAAGVGCVVHRKLTNRIVDWKAVSERILAVELRSGRKETMTVISIYGPDENERTNEKEKFWEDLTTTTEEAKGTIYIAGDFNSRVGKSDEEYDTMIGKHGEEVRNKNGKRMLEFCRLHDMIVTNTFYPHKDIHRYTRVQPKRNERSIIDYILTPRENRRSIMDVRVKRGAEIYSDHHLLVARIKQRDIEIKKTKEERHTAIRTYRLRDTKTATKYQQAAHKNIERKINEIKRADAQQGWSIFKEAIITAAKETCGVCKPDKRKKQTPWWTEEVREEVKRKKREWRKYLANSTTEQYEIYKNQRKKAKEVVITSKERSWADFGEKMERDSVGNQKLFYRVLRSFRKERQEGELYIKNKKQEILTNETEIMERWKEYFQELLGQQIQTEDERTTENQPENRGNETEVENIKIEELREVLEALKNGKAPGNDKITNEMMKNLGEESIEVLLMILNKVWTNEKIPQDWGTALITPIYKKGDRKQCDNYRGITLLNTIMKIYEQIINNRIRPILESQISKSQSGFMSGRSTQDHIFTIKQIIEKRDQQNKKLYLAFIDLEKAFDTVPREKVWKGLEERKIHKKIIRKIKDIYETNINYIIKDNLRSSGFKTEKGLRQGGALSPTMFNVYMDRTIKKCDKRVNKMFVGYKNLKRIEIANGIFVDDVVLIAGSEKQLQENLNIWNETMKEEGMKMNMNKTKILVIGNPDIGTGVKVDDTRIEQVKSFKYLGTMIDRTGRQDAEINERIEKTIRLYYAMNQKFIKKKEITKQTKIKIYNTIYRPVLTYGCESWTLTSNQRSKIQATEMKYLRGVVGKTRRDRVRNEQIREELGVQPIMEFIEQRQLSWWGHLQRMNNDRPVKQIYEARLQAKRRRGRPRQTWNGMIGDILQRRGKPWREAAALARDRQAWRKFIYRK